LVGSITCRNREREWQLLEAQIGRLGYHFRPELAGINIQLGPTWK